MLINRKDQVVTKWWSLQRLTFAYISNTSPTFGSQKWKKCWLGMSCPQGKFCNKEIPEAYRCGFLFSMGIFPTSPGVYHLPLKTIVQVASQSCFIGFICCRASKWHSAQTPRLYQFTVFCTVPSWKALPDEKIEWNRIELESLKPPINNANLFFNTTQWLCSDLRYCVFGNVSGLVVMLDQRFLLQEVFFSLPCLQIQKWKCQYSRQWFCYKSAWDALITQFSA